MDRRLLVLAIGMFALGSLATMRIAATENAKPVAATA